MKKVIALLFLPLIFIGQIRKEISLNYPVKDYSGTTNSLKVIDGRPDKNIGQFVSRGQTYQLRFPTEDPVEDIQNWFERFNKNRKKGNRDLILYLEKLKVKDEVENDEIFCVLDFKVSTFVSDGNGYYFLDRYDNILRLSNKDYGNISSIFEENIGKVIQKLLFDSYRAKSIEQSIPKEELANYENILKISKPAFTENALNDGVYLNSEDFFSQKPLEGYQLNTKENGKVEAVGTNGKLAQRKIFIYVHQGKAFKNTNIGFLPLEKDDRGYFIMSNRLALFPEEIKVSPVFFFFGAVGGIAAGITVAAKHQNAAEGIKNKIYLDFLTGDYSFTK
ncbi:hypothetical protein [Chryseobacterium koreense]|uniref:hypothetical protein n=1 Tax=Chryseobacterium koreense TaxID=232216 RepID=UPI0026F0C1D5|nr:hypothetical protein [Chryseobacterium koreense]